jgi:hypothetical protein
MFMLFVKVGLAYIKCAEESFAHVFHETVNA